MSDHHRFRNVAAACAVLLCLNPSVLYAQGATFSVDAASAAVHKAPSTGSPVIGRAPRGTRLDVTRELGSWVKVAWPEAEDGAGYVHVSTVSRAGAPAPAGDVRLAPANRPAASASTPATTEPAGHVASASSPVPVQPTYVVPPAHVIGLGGRTGDATLGTGASVRTWFHDRLAVQFEVSRSSLTSPLTPGRLTATQYAPSVLVSLPDRITDYVWVRPYLGAGPRLLRRTLSILPQGGGVPVSESSVGFQTFGGGELTFASVPRFALSADVRYGWLGDPAPGFDLDGVGFSLSGHWYIK